MTNLRYEPESPNPNHRSGLMSDLRAQYRASPLGGAAGLPGQVAQKGSFKRLFVRRGMLVNPGKLESVDLLGLRWVDYDCCKLQGDT